MTSQNRKQTVQSKSIVQKYHYFDKKKKKEEEEEEDRGLFLNEHFKKVESSFIETMHIQ